LREDYETIVNTYYINEESSDKYKIQEEEAINYNMIILKKSEEFYKIFEENYKFLENEAKKIEWKDPYNEVEIDKQRTIGFKAISDYEIYGETSFEENEKYYHKMKNIEKIEKEKFEKRRIEKLKEKERKQIEKYDTVYRKQKVDERIDEEELEEIEKMRRHLNNPNYLEELKKKKQKLADSMMGKGRVTFLDERESMRKTVEMFDLKYSKKLDPKEFEKNVSKEDKERLEKKVKT